MQHSIGLTEKAVAGNTAPLLESALPSSVEFPAVFFMDSKLAAQYHVEIPKTNIPVPGYVNALIGDVSTRRNTIAHHFNTVHEWMPIISKKGFLENINPFNPLDAGCALLILCMGLIAWHPNEEAPNPRSPMYMAAKRYQLELEICGVLSIRTLQASVFITLYESGHAIYPSAFLSVATCARYGSALGIDWRVSSPWKRPFSWIDAEEKNRLWWAVITLDRISCIGSIDREPIIPDPESHILVPSDTKAWDDGMKSLPCMYTIATPPIMWGECGSSGLIAQATKLLGQVLRHISSENTLDEEEAIVLNDTLKALSKLLESPQLSAEESHELSTMNQESICDSALILLHEAHATTNPITKTGVYFESIHRAHFVASAVRTAMRQEMLTCMHSASPFVPILMYQAGCVSLRFHKKCPTSETLQNFEAMKQVLTMFKERWKNSESFLKILEAQELHTITDNPLS
ncbi:fungal specific transcription factor domain-containing protein [Phlyctema vagabunda]|uniref:Fungal specific transcription factor domain-containing protein n=1 Tax=Phlyctema vagabunda TaxID=108571 RepID=A0ABR4PKH8_9HELO